MSAQETQEICNLIDDLGPDADLLVRPNEYIDFHLCQLAGQIALLARQYESARKARHIKRVLQEQNQVAVQILERDCDTGMLKDIGIKIMPLLDAARAIAPAKDCVERANTTAQLSTWRKDGYDLQGTTDAYRRRVNHDAPKV